MFGVAGRHARRRTSSASLLSSSSLLPASRSPSRLTAASPAARRNTGGSQTSLCRSPVPPGTTPSPARSPGPHTSGTSPGRSPGRSPSRSPARSSIGSLEGSSGVLTRRHSSLTSDGHGILMEEEEEEEGAEEGSEREKKAKLKKSDEEESSDEEKPSRDLEDHLEEEEEMGTDGKSPVGEASDSRRLSERSVGSHKSDMNGGSHAGTPSLTVGPIAAKKQVRLSLPNGPYLSRYPPVLSPSPLTGAGYFRRRQAVNISDYKSCALVQANMKMGLGDIM
ncbi:uncharacterized protein [Palaemon carinicauda]|uniref:uncharacterized protein n=1 Tax=Palaemon carinicauda TaxID=392227 RepID=UPI0035B5BD31